MEAIVAGEPDETKHLGGDEEEFEFATGVAGKRKRAGMTRELRSTVDTDKPSSCTERCLCYTCDGEHRRYGTVGNFTVLWERQQPSGERELLCVVGPFWHVMAFVTTPLIVGISLVIAVTVLKYHNIVVVVTFPLLVVVALVALWSTACTNPGILRRRRQTPADPESLEQGQWIWCDQADTYRPSKARYDRDCDAVVEKFDHVCPWTGTAIGRGNIRRFYVFVATVHLLLYYALFVLVYGIILMRKN